MMSRNVPFFTDNVPISTCQLPILSLFKGKFVCYIYNGQSTGTTKGPGPSPFSFAKEYRI